MRQFTSVRRSGRVLVLVIVAILTLTLLAGCGPSQRALGAVDYTPQAGGDWPVSTPQAQGLDPDLVARLYHDAAQLETIYSLLLVKNGNLIAEDYFNAGSIDQLSKRASVTKSYTGALFGIALQEGYLTSLDQKMLDFFPEVADRISDPRKFQITLREMLQMRAGYPWEEESAAAWATLWGGEYISPIADIPLVSDPGAEFHYSNLTANWLAIITTRATGTDLKTFGQDNLFTPLSVGEWRWLQDVDGYYIGSGDIEFTAPGTWPSLACSI